MHIILRSPGFEGYTGPIGSIMFKDGKSEEPVSHREAIRVGSAFHVVFEDGREVSAAAEVIDFSNREMAVQKEAARKDQAVVQEPAKAEPVSVVEPTVQPDEKTETETETEAAEVTETEAAEEPESSDSEEPAQTVAEEPVIDAPALNEQPSTLYTREQLEAVADAKGISGLREIGNQHNVRGNSIEVMIERLLLVKA